MRFKWGEGDVIGLYCRKWFHQLAAKGSPQTRQIFGSLDSNQNQLLNFLFSSNWPGFRFNISVNSIDKKKSSIEFPFLQIIKRRSEWSFGNKLKAAGIVEMIQCSHAIVCRAGRICVVNSIKRRPRATISSYHAIRPNQQRPLNLC